MDSKRPKPTKSKHGTRSRYNLGCRCPRCAESNRAYANSRKEYQATYQARPAKEKNLTHGLYSAYKNGCRCARCTKANREYHREYQAENAA